MSDLISRQGAIDKINERQRKLIYCFGFENDMVKIMNIAKSIITGIPSAQPEIVRCKDCKHRIEHKHYGDLGESAYTCEGNMGGWILPDDYCSMAERRDNG